MPTQHYTKENLELYRQGQLSVLAQLKCRLHLKSCSECNRLLEELQQDDAFLQEFRQSINTYGEPCKEMKLPPIK